MRAGISKQLKVSKIITLNCLNLVSRKKRNGTKQIASAQSKQLKRSGARAISSLQTHSKQCSCISNCLNAKLKFLKESFQIIQNKSRIMIIEKMHKIHITKLKDDESKYKLWQQIVNVLKLYQQKHKAWQATYQIGTIDDDFAKNQFTILFNLFI